MKLPNWLIDRLWCCGLAVLMGREPDFVIGGLDNPYLLRWYLTPWSGLYRDIPPQDRTRWQRFVTRLPNLYLHIVLRSDDDRALHDHPWPNLSIPISGCIIEHTIAAGGIHHRRTLRPGDLVFRRGPSAHRLEVPSERTGNYWSLFLTGWRSREWGFHCPERGWVHWRDFTNPADGGATVGRGCDQ